MAGVESLAASLVREYLSRKGLKTTLKALDNELPRTPESISNRAQLAKEMHIEKLMKKNKDNQQDPLRTMLEVIVKFMRERGTSSLSCQPASESVISVTQSVTSPPEIPARDKRRQLQVKSDHKIMNVSKTVTSERQDYDELLKRLEKRNTVDSAGNDSTPSQHKPSERETKKSLGSRLLKSKNTSEHKEMPLHDDSDSSLLNLSVNSMNSNASFHKSERILESSSYSQTIKQVDGTQKAKTKKHRGLNGPVMSSGLTSSSGRPGRLQYDDKGLGHNLTLNKGRLFDDEPRQTEALQGEVFAKLKPVDSRERVSRNNLLAKQQESRASIESSEIAADTLSERLPIASHKHVTKSKVDELLFEDIDEDFDQELGQLSLGPTRRIVADFESKLISLETAMALKNLIFGTATSSFNAEWRNQSFKFCDLYNLEYGIVQEKGGPCGELAAVQCFILKYLLFVEENDSTDRRICLQPSSKKRTKALVSALVEILWRAGSHKSAVVVSPSGNSSFVGAGRYKPDQLTETLVLHTFKSFESLKNFVAQHIQQFASGSSSGCILFLYSVILSRTIERVKSDMDEPSTTLMGAHGYCTQEIVNLIVTGRAVSNVFDGVMELDSGGTTKSTLKGIDKQGEVGLLSLFEHYGSCKVGTHLKTPKYPIWVICSESHFSVLFSTDKNLLKERRHGKKFDLLYYDGLARQDEEIRLTVDMTRECPEYKDGDLVPPLELCIRTRWRKCCIDWNGSEPIL